MDIMCFDKTGTLTEDGLDVLGVRAVSPDKNTLNDMVSEPEALSGNEEDLSLRVVLHTMATCHSLRSVDGELVGDPLDVKMFEFTQWSFEEGSQGAPDADEDDVGGLNPSIARPPGVSNVHLPATRCVGLLTNLTGIHGARRSQIVRVRAPITTS